MPTVNPLSGSELYEFFETIIEDSMDETAAYILMNNAKNKVEGEREWEILKKFDSSKTATTAAIDLPSDFDRPIDGIIYVGSQPYIQIPFEQQRLSAHQTNRWYLDMRQSKYYLTGSPTSGQIWFPYIYQTDDITADTYPVWPAKFHPLIAFEMAELHFMIDQAERPFSWDDRWAAQHLMLKRSMIDWDVKLSRRAVENGLPPDTDNEIPLGMM